MRYLISLLSFIIAASCVTNSAFRTTPVGNLKDFGHVRVDPLLSPMFLEFLAECEKHESVEHICFENLAALRSIQLAPDEVFQKPSTIGFCMITGHGSRLISIRRSTAIPDSVSLRTLVFHELGHCLLDSGHSPENSPHIMNPFILPDSFSKDNWHRLVKELFECQYPWESPEDEEDICSK